MAQRLSRIVPGGADLAPLSRAVFGHHRTPVPEDKYRLAPLVGQHELAAAEVFVTEVSALLTPPRIAVAAGADLVRSSWLVAGLTMISDWIGSSQAVFEYERPNVDFPTYWRTIALPRARAIGGVAGRLP